MNSVSNLYSFYPFFNLGYYLCGLKITNGFRKAIRMRGQLLFIVAMLFTLLLESCSEYNKILKSNDYELKYTKAKEYYNEGEYYKSLPLFEELMSFYRMTDKGEDVYYYYANNQYALKEYYMASYYFKRFAKNYPNSPRAQECAFLAAICKKELSPEYNLDQSETYAAIDEFQLFMDRYPNSNLVDSCNSVIRTLRAKLEKKSYENAKLFYRMEKYRSAVIAFNSTLQSYPDTDYKEEILFLIVKSNYLFASNSIESKKVERYEETIKSYHKFVDSFGSSKWLKQAENYYNSSVKELAKLKNNSIANQ